MASEQVVQVTNRVYRGELGHPPDYLELEAMCIVRDFTYRFHRGRPTMFSVKWSEPRCTALFFSSGRFRLMGKITEDAARQVLEMMGLNVQLNLKLQTETVTFHTQPVTLLFVYRHDKELLYEGELFPAIHLRRWKKHFVNLFFSGSVVIMGPQSSRIASQVKLWLEREIALDMHKPATHERLNHFVPPNADVDFTPILKHLPETL